MDENEAIWRAEVLIEFMPMGGFSRSDASDKAWFWRWPTLIIYYIFSKNVSYCILTCLHQAREGWSRFEECTILFLHAFAIRHLQTTITVASTVTILLLYNCSHLELMHEKHLMNEGRDTHYTYTTNTAHITHLHSCRQLQNIQELTATAVLLSLGTERTLLSLLHDELLDPNRSTHWMKH